MSDFKMFCPSSPTRLVAPQTRFSAQRWDEDRSGASSDSGSFDGTVSASDTITTTQTETFSESLYEAGVYNGGSFAFSNVVYNESSTSSSTSQENDSFTSTDTRTGNDSAVYSGLGLGGGQDTVTGNATITASSVATETLYESGSYSNDSYSLGSFALLEQSSQTQTTTSISTASAAESGSSSGNEGFAGAVVYSGTGSYSDIAGSNSTAQETSTESFSLSEQGTFGNGRLSVSSYVFTQQQSSSSSLSQSGSWTESLSGTNLGNAYTASSSGSFSSSFYNLSSATLSEQGSYANGSFNLSVFSYTGTGNDSTSAEQSDASSWSGSYSGTENASANESSNSHWTISLSGNYGGGSFSLATDILQGNSSGNYSNDESDQETRPSGSGGSFGGGGSFHTSYSRSDSGSQTDNYYQSGTISAGVYSNVSYNVSGAEGDELTTASSAPSYTANDTLQDSNSMAVTVNDGSASESESSLTTYSWFDNPNNAGPSSGVGTSSWQTSFAVSVPEGVIPPSLDGTSIPEDGAEDSGGMAPVAAAQGMLLLGATSEWMQSQSAYANEVTNNAVDYAVDAVPQAGQLGINPLGAPAGLLQTSPVGMASGASEEASSAGSEQNQVFKENAGSTGIMLKSIDQASEEPPRYFTSAFAANAAPPSGSGSGKANIPPLEAVTKPSFGTAS